MCHYFFESQFHRNKVNKEIRAALSRDREYFPSRSWMLNTEDFETLLALKEGVYDQIKVEIIREHL